MKEIRTMTKMENFQFIPINRIRENSNNPRKIFKGIEELAEDLKKRGMLEPVLVRPMPENGDYELVFGARRLRAAMKAELPEIPAMIREMPDEEALETMIVENSKRDDMHPLEEADGYKALLERYKWDIPAIAAKVGKSLSVIYQRLKLLDLIEPVRKAFMEEKITPGHALLIARLQPKDQKTALEEGCFERWRDKELVSVRSLAQWIENEIHLDLNSASFKKNDPDLVPEAGPCTTCPKRTGYIPELFPDVKKKDTCTDRTCFNRKIEAFIDRWIQVKSEDSDTPPLRLSTEYDGRVKSVKVGDVLKSNQYREIQGKKERCEFAREGIITEGREQGKVMTVCANPECKAHRIGSGRYMASPEELARRKTEQEKKKIEETVREGLVVLVLATSQGKPLTTEDWILITGQFFKEIYFDKQRDILKRLGIEPGRNQHGGFDLEKPLKKHLSGLAVDQFPRLLFQIAVVLAKNKYGGWDSNKDLLIETAKRFGLKPKTIEDEISAEFKEKKAKGKKKLKPPAKKKLLDRKPKTGPCGMELNKDGFCSHLMGMECEALAESTVKCCRVCENDSCNIRCSDAPKPSKKNPRKSIKTKKSREETVP